MCLSLSKVELLSSVMERAKVLQKFYVFPAQYHFFYSYSDFSKGRLVVLWQKAVSGQLFLSTLLVLQTQMSSGDDLREFLAASVGQK